MPLTREGDEAGSKNWRMFHIDFRIRGKQLSQFVFVRRLAHQTMVCLAPVGNCVIIHYLKRKLHPRISLKCGSQDLVPFHYFLQSMLKALDINRTFEQQCKLRAPLPSAWQAPKVFLLRRELESRGGWSRHRPTLLLEFVIT